MKESNFKSKFNLIFKVTLQLVLTAQGHIQSQKTVESLNDSKVDIEDIQLQEITSPLAGRKSSLIQNMVVGDLHNIDKSKVAVSSILNN